MPPEDDELLELEEPLELEELLEPVPSQPPVLLDDEPELPPSQPIAVKISNRVNRKERPVFFAAALNKNLGFIVAFLN